ncbi:putative flap endonuclease-1-like 5' DNA nuclease [Roseicyclus mahoneyensis]|uniref:Putative flap endonuclease-1-like 5' DNA nuclease n=2 Tax=Roseicyclus mahoneyensis TaxID=164332 RepID=A0A316GIZ2_9RHOB|nr:putative flap endonuclease-1-like 5' DNA nuclease [Roseicyclus mahoneyensis]
MTEAMWLRGQAAQRDFFHLVVFGTAFVGAAAVQAIALGLTAPRSYWAALGRAAAAPPRLRSKPPRKSVAEVVKLTPPALVVPDAPRIPRAAPAPTDPEATATASQHLRDAPRGGVADDLTRLKGVGPKLEAALNEFGIYRFDQIAALDEEGIAWLDAQQKGFRMICARHDIVAQARALV